MKRRAGRRPLRGALPGFYVSDDEEGTLHVEAAEVFAALGWPDTPVTQALLERVVRGVVSERAPACLVEVVEDGA